MWNKWAPFPLLAEENTNHHYHVFLNATALRGIKNRLNKFSPCKQSAAVCSIFSIISLLHVCFSMLQYPCCIMFFPACLSLWLSFRWSSTRPHASQGPNKTSRNNPRYQASPSLDTDRQAFASNRFHFGECVAKRCYSCAISPLELCKMSILLN